MSTQLGQAYVKLGLDASNYEEGINKAKNSLSSLSTILASIAGLGVGATLIEFGKGALKASSDFEQAQVSFEVMLGSAQKAAVLTTQLQNMANITPFETQDLTENAKVLLNFGETLQDIVPDLQMLGDISGGNAEKLKSLTLVFGQMSANGRLMGQDLLQMINAGFNPLQIISQKTGKSMSQLREEMEKGQISASMVKQAFKDVTSKGGKFYQMMGKQSKTLAGEWSTLQDATTQISRTIGNELAPTAKDVVEDLTKMAKTTNDNITKFADWVSVNQTTIKGVTDLGIALAAIATGLLTATSISTTYNTVSTAISATLGTTKTSAFLLASILEGDLLTAVKITTAATVELTTALLANPWTWVVAGITATVAVLYTIHERQQAYTRACKDATANNIKEAQSSGSLVEQLKTLNIEKRNNIDVTNKVNTVRDELIKKFPSLRRQISADIEKWGELTKATKEAMATEIAYGNLKPYRDKYEKAMSETQYFYNQISQGGTPYEMHNQGLREKRKNMAYQATEKYRKNEEKARQELIRQAKLQKKAAFDEINISYTNTASGNKGNQDSTKPAKPAKTKKSKEGDTAYEKAKEAYETYITNEEIKGIELSNNQKLAAYNSYLGKVKKSSKEELDFKKGQADLIKAKDKDVLDLKLANLDVEKYATKKTDDEIYKIDLEKIELQMQAEKKGTIDYKQLLAQKLQLEQEHKEKIKQVKLQANVEQLDYDKELLDDKINNLPLEVEQHKITLSQKLELERQYIQKKKDLDEKATTAQLEIVKGNAAEELKIKRSGNKNIEQDSKDAADNALKIWQNQHAGLIAFEDSMTSGWSQAVSDMIKGNVEFSDAMGTVEDIVLNSFAAMAQKIVEQWIESHLLMKAAAVATANTQTQANISTAVTGAAASQASIPIAGPALAAAAIASMIALLAEFREDGGSVTAGKPYIVGEKRPELFIPSTDGTILPNLNSVNNNGSSSQPVVVNVAYSVSAIDSKSFAGQIKNQSKLIGELASKEIAKNQRNWR